MRAYLCCHLHQLPGGNDLPTSSSLLTSSSPPQLLLQRGCASHGCPQLGLFSLPYPQGYFCLSHSEMEKQSIRHSGRLFSKVACSLYIFRVIANLFGIDLQSWGNDKDMGLNFTHFGEGGQGVQGGYEGADRYYFPCIYSSNKMESFKTFTDAGIITQCKQGRSQNLNHACP